MARRDRHGRALENIFLPFEGAKSADVGNRERHPELAFVASAEVEAPILDTQPAAIGVVSHLGL